MHELSPIISPYFAQLSCKPIVPLIISFKIFLHEELGIIEYNVGIQFKGYKSIQIRSYSDTMFYWKIILSNALCIPPTHEL